MQWPSGDRYQEAVQNPSTSFFDSELKICTIETMLHGLPKPYAGNFTTTYHLYNHSNHWAVRCFTRDIPDLQKRYKEIGRFLQISNTGFFVDATYVPNGILITGQWYPVIKMTWVNGDTLSHFINNNISNPGTLGSLVNSFQSMIAAMDSMDLAHGDLQHGNIMVKKGQIFLIDYDGMYLPTLSDLQSNELGHPNYQHPMRSDCHYDANMDRFSSIVIWLGLKALSVDPKLWDKYNSYENILFTRNDFLDPDNSQLLSELATYPKLINFVDRFKGVCFMGIDQIPTLDQFISGDITYPTVREYSIASNKSVSIKPQPVSSTGESLTKEYYYPDSSVENTTVTPVLQTKFSHKWIIAIALIGFLIFSVIPIFPITISKQVPFEESYQESYQVPYQESYQVAEQVPYQVSDLTAYKNSWGATGSRDTTDYAALMQTDPRAKFYTRTEYRTVYRTEYRTTYRTEYRTAYRTAYRNEQYTRSISLIQLLTGSKS